jgi:hypothetical protein
LLRHLANGHVRDVDGSDAPGNILTVPQNTDAIIIKIVMGVKARLFGCRLRHR